MPTHVFLVLMLALVALGCAKKEAKQTDLVTFPLRGMVVNVDSTDRTIMIAHEAIPDYMPAMTMPFKVKDPSLLRGVHEGDSVGATLAVSRVESWLETISVVRPGERVESLSADEVEHRHTLSPGDPVPDALLLDQEGHVVRLSTFRGKAVALTFIYARCPLPDFCIRMSENFAKLQRALRADPSLNDRWHLVSVSFDPAYDRPRVLKQYGSNYGADFSVWSFLTDPDTTGPAIEQLAGTVGLSYHPNEGLIEHNLRTMVIDREGKLVSVINGNSWSVEELAEQMKGAARN